MPLSGTAGFFNPKWRWHVQRTADRRVMIFRLCSVQHRFAQVLWQREQIHLLFDLLRSHQRFHLSDHRTLDLGRRLVKPDRVP